MSNKNDRSGESRSKPVSMSEFRDDLPEAPELVAIEHDDIDKKDDSGVSVDSDAIKDSPPKSRPPMPAMPSALKFGLPLLLMVIVGGGVLVMSFLSGGGEISSDEVAVSQYSLDGASDAGDESPSVVSTMPATPESDPVSLSDRVADIELALVPLRDAAKNIEAPLSAVQSRLASLDAEFSRLSRAMRQLDTNLGTLTDLVTDLQSSTSDIRQDLSRLTNRVSKNTRALKARAQRVVNRPPFRLVSIDEWGGEFSAVLEMGGASTVAAIGDQRAGWTVTRIDRSGCIFVTRIGAPTMKPVKVCQEVS